MAEKLALTREEFKKLKEAGETAKPVQQKQAIPIYLRFVILFVLIIVFASAGALVGYSGIGHGKPSEFLKGSAFSHIYDLVEKK
ncbi:DNA-directed RNA polymerase subunit beta [Neobacillus sp. PS3-12]|uniref:DNA-directed RNA polymerase subunit beta n=1 Tax=Neobacillus sp. PS3-12 TaxID=3070677 RepID=UPI0027E2050B|nr:DNA-directed RNA polymerase subunit beta [Neobacillus sp. PS3-12]WML55231.1 DNA-directed RNA polymerase subunit beta [Neobacillus sp. PS3-12]